MNPKSPVVLIHGWPVTAAHWRLLTPRLRVAGHEVLELTLPGLGTGSLGVRDFSKLSLAAWVLEQIDAAGYPDFALVGHDWGGTVAAFVASLARDRVRALVIEEEVAPGLNVDIPEPGAFHYPSWHGAFNASPGLAEGLVPGRESIYFGAFLRQSAGPGGLQEDVVEEYVGAYAQPGVLEASLAHYRTPRDRFNVAELTAAPLVVPALAVGGYFGFGGAVAEGLSLFASDVREFIAPHSGHYPAEQEPDPTAEAILGFLDGS